MFVHCTGNLLYHINALHLEIYDTDKDLMVLRIPHKTFTN